MDTQAILKKESLILLGNLILGIGLLAAGIFIQTFAGSKAIIAISFIPFSLVVSSLLKIFKLKKNPGAYIEENDERLITAKNRADAVSLRIIRYLLMLAFLAFTFTNPKEVFESLNWWLLLVVSLLTVLLPAIILGNVNKNYPAETKE